VDALRFQRCQLIPVGGCTPARIAKLSFVQRLETAAFSAHTARCHVLQFNGKKSRRISVVAARNTRFIRQHLVTRVDGGVFLWIDQGAEKSTLMYNSQVATRLFGWIDKSSKIEQ
jgi:hypothetical protein